MPLLLRAFFPLGPSRKYFRRISSFNLVRTDEAKVFQDDFPIIRYSFFLQPSFLRSVSRIIAAFESCIEFLVTVTVQPRSRRNRGGKFARNERVRGMPVEVFARPVTYRVHTPGKAGRRVSVSRHRGNRRG